MNHRDQETFNVAIMNYKNFSTYMQRQINRILRKHRNYVKIYINDIIIFSKTLKKHRQHLIKIFDTLNVNNIIIKSQKIFINYSTVQLLNQKIDSFDLVIAKDKLKTIVKLRFSKNLQQLKTYLKLISWLKNYIFHYAEIFKPLQKRKTKLLQNDSIAESVRKTYSKRIKMKYSIKKEFAAFKTLQAMFLKSSFLIHINFARQLYINLNVNKKFDFNTIIYYIKDNWKDINYLSQSTIESILFLNKLINDAKSRYWSIKLKLTDIVWVLKKIRHLMKTFTLTTIIYIDHDVALRIIKQISLIIFFINKLNLRLIRAFNYLQRFNLNIRHKFKKQHIIFDALFKLFSDNNSQKFFANDELNALYIFPKPSAKKSFANIILFITFLIKMNSKFKRRILKKYKSDLNWQRIFIILNENDGENAVKLPFYQKNDLIFRSDQNIKSHDYQSRRLCISHSIIKNILNIAHNEDIHSEYARCYKTVSFNYYIRDLTKYLKNYLKHCSKCQVFQTKRHKSYDSLQPILISSISFYIIIIDFVLTLSLTTKNWNCLMSIICKFIKRILLILNKTIWTAIDWDHALLNKFDTADWKLPKIIISDRNKKFLSKLWTAMFIRLNVKLFYSATYHPQTNE